MTPSDEVTVRRARPDDMSAVAELVGLTDNRTYSVTAVEKALGRLDPNLCLAWLAFMGGRAVGSSMLEVRTLRCGTRTCRAGYWTNLFIHSSCRNLNIYPLLALRTFREASSVGLEVVYAAVRRRRVATAHLAMGMRRICDLPVLIKPLRPLRLLAKSRDCGTTFAKLAGYVDSVYNMASCRWRSRALPALPVEDINWDSHDLSKLLDLFDTSVAGRLHQLRTESSFRERFTYNLDEAPYHLLGVRKGEGFNAGVICRLAVRGNQIRAGVIMDLFHEPDELNTARLCLLAAERRLYDQGAEVMLCLPGMGATASQGLRRLGYLESNETYAVLWKDLSKKEGEEKTIPDGSRFHFAFSDHDAF